MAVAASIAVKTARIPYDAGGLPKGLLVKAIFASVLCLGLAACAGGPGMGLACGGGTQAMTKVELFFGGDVGAVGGVSEADWQNFLATEVTPRFPDGFSVADIYGQWRGPMGRIESERSKTLIVILPDAASRAAQIESLRAAYKTRFRQQSVLLVETPVCAGF